MSWSSTTVSKLVRAFVLANFAWWAAYYYATQGWSLPTLLNVGFFALQVALSTPWRRRDQRPRPAA
ncbi:MAG: hypothetical protein JWO31_3849 [Phycisphaerales bacterium]|nr:hypothetical protein [Phycisphaerales bacterium]